MSPHFANWNERTLDLAIERYTVGLEPDACTAFERDAFEDDLRDFEAALAAVHAGHLDVSTAPPASLLERIEANGREQVRRRFDAEAAPREPDSAPTPRLRRAPAASFVSRLGWAIAAAFAIAFALNRGEPLTRPATRAELVARTDVVQLPWAATEDSAARGATGDVVWSPSEQRGFMTFRGLEANDPSTSQYQLWIFDPTRPDWEARPVDGGVFDVGGDVEVVVEIDAKLEVRETALFAVTIERPGGVVVSERERIVLTAAP